jgi:hypothetical protein
MGMSAYPRNLGSSRSCGQRQHALNLRYPVLDHRPFFISFAEAFTEKIANCGVI